MKPTSYPTAWWICISVLSILAAVIAVVTR